MVPGSHVRILAEGDYVMFSVTVLRGQTEAGKYEGDVFVAGNIYGYIPHSSVCQLLFVYCSAHD